MITIKGVCTVVDKQANAKELVPYLLWPQGFSLELSKYHGVNLKIPLELWYRVQGFSLEILVRGVVSRARERSEPFPSILILSVLLVRFGCPLITYSLIQPPYQKCY